MPIGNPVTLTSNVASKAISVTATASQTLFNVTGGYRINELGVFKNGLRLQDGVDYTARDGLTVTLLSAASGGDKLQFVVFDTFRVAEAIRPSVDEQTIRGNLNVVGILSCTDLEGPVSLNITSGIQTFHDVRVGGALTVAGTLTYEDTTNSNVTGIATFSGGMNISAIGATATTLNVTGFSTFSDNVSIGDSIFHTGDTDTSIRFPAADTFTVETAGGERLRITSGGNIGVKTDTPAAPLHIDGDNDAKNIVLSRDGGASGRRPFGIGIGGGSDANFRISASGDTLGANAFDNQIIDITAAGNIGIKTDTPAAPLHVDSDNAYGSFVLSRDGGVSGRRPFGFGISGATDANFRISASGDTLSENAFDNQIIDITAAGNVGIGSLIPQKKLDVAGDVKIVENSPRLEFHDANSGSLSNVTGGFETFDRSGNRATYVGAGMENGGNIVEFGTNNTFRAIIDSSGNVGINSSAPRSKVDVSGDLTITKSSNNPAIIFDEHSGGTDPKAKIQMDQTNSTNAELLFYTEGSGTLTERLRINSGGDVNITGITTATQLFEGTTRVASTGKAIAMAMLFG